MGIAVCRKRDTDLTVVEIESNVRKAPVPQLGYGGSSVVDGNVANCVLLVAYVESLETSVDHDVANEAGGSYFVSNSPVKSIDDIDIPSSIKIPVC